MQAKGPFWTASATGFPGSPPWDSCAFAAHNPVELAGDGRSAPIVGQNHVLQRVRQFAGARSFTVDDIADRALTPARLFIEADTQGGLRYHLMGEEGISGMDSAKPRIAEESLITRRAKDAIPAHHVEAPVDYAPGTFDGMILGSKYFGRPMRAVIDAA
jgi:hypothetical protein